MSKNTKSKGQPSDERSSNKKDKNPDDRISKAVRQQIAQFKSMFPSWNGAANQDVLQLFSEFGGDFGAACDAVIGGYNTKRPPDSWKEVPTKQQKSKEAALKKQQRAKAKRAEYERRGARGDRQERYNRNSRPDTRDQGRDSRGSRPQGRDDRRTQAGPADAQNPTQSSSAPQAATAPKETHKSQPPVQSFPNYASAAAAGRQAWSQTQSTDGQSPSQAAPTQATQPSATDSAPASTPAAAPASEEAASQNQAQAQAAPAQNQAQTSQQSQKPQARVVLPGGYAGNEEVPFRFGSVGGAGYEDQKDQQPKQDSQAGQDQKAAQNQQAAAVPQMAGGAVVPDQSNSPQAVPVDYQMQMAQMQGVPAMDPESLQAMGYLQQGQFMQTPYGFDGSEAGPMAGRVPVAYYDNAQAYAQAQAFRDPKYQQAGNNSGKYGDNAQAAPVQAPGASGQQTPAQQGQGAPAQPSGTPAQAAAAAHYQQQNYSPMYYPAYMGQFPAYQTPSQYPPFAQRAYYAKGFNPAAGFGNGGYPGAGAPAGYDEEYSKSMYGAAAGGVPQQSFFNPDGTQGQQSTSTGGSAKPQSGSTQAVGAAGAKSGAAGFSQEAQAGQNGQQLNPQMGGQGYMARGNSPGNYYMTPFAQGTFPAFGGQQVPGMPQAMAYQQMQQAQAAQSQQTQAPAQQQTAGQQSQGQGQRNF